MEVVLTQKADGNNIVVTGTVTNLSPLPTSNIFIYKNTGTLVLGNYIGIPNLEELTSLTVWNSQIIPIYNNTYVLFNALNATIQPGNFELFVAHVNTCLSNLVSQYLQSTITTSITLQAQAIQDL